MNSVGDLWRPVRQQVIEESGETDATVKAEKTHWDFVVT